ncbi:MAG TPA: pyrroline-5-carboxylate reductase [Rhizomicrobium sp.]|nr:pyrroline-5-carboxylate reductase [Rhizomicrobium sp.]
MILLIGAGRMGSALLKGWIAKRIGPIAVVEPKPSPALRKLARAKPIALHKSVAEVRAKPRACVIAIKPQVLKTEASVLKDIAGSGALMISIAAGSSLKLMRRAWGGDARIIRAMPNMPGQIGRGISALYAAEGATPADRKLAERLLAALGETLWVPRECLIDSVTAVSGSGPAYVFLFVEALAAAARKEGLSPEAADRLARATITGAGALLDADRRPPSELRRDVTSPGGTTEAALSVLMSKDGLASLVARAVRAANRRARELGS